jgi:iron complex transport system substrate-binding protein
VPFRASHAREQSRAPDRRRACRHLVGWAFGAAACLSLVVSPAAALDANVPADTRVVTDSAGRTVTVPTHIARVQAAGPPATVLLYVLAAEKLIGWVRKPSAAELEFLNPKVRELPEIGRLTGRGDTANLEVVIKAKPDLVIDFGTVNPTYVSLADRVQSQTGIPYLLIDGRLASTVASMKLVGNILGVDARANALADKAAAIMGEAEQTVAAVPEAQRPRVYLARQANGLQTGNRGSINTEIIERAGGVNVATGGREGGGLFNVSPEQVIAWNPDTVITVGANFFASVHSTPAWSDIAAVKDNRVFLSPDLPYGWIDEPPSLNRLLGLQWLLRLFYPQRFHGDVQALTRDFYKQFYQVDLTDAQLDRLLAGTRGRN